MVRSDSGDVDSSINIGYKNLVTGRNIGNGVLFGCGEESRQKEASPCLEDVEQSIDIFLAAFAFANAGRDHEGGNGNEYRCCRCETG